MHKDKLKTGYSKEYAEKYIKIKWSQDKTCKNVTKNWDSTRKKAKELGFNPQKRNELGLNP